MAFLIRNDVFRMHTKKPLGLTPFKNIVWMQNSPSVMEKWLKKISEKSIVVALVFLVFLVVFPKTG